MTGPKFLTHRGARILVLDYSGATLDRLPGLLEEAERVIREHSHRSLLLLTRMAGYQFGDESNRLLLQHIDANRPWALASAVVGLGHLAAVVPIANRLSGRNLVAFDSESDALDWLANQARREASPDDGPVRLIACDGCTIVRIDFRDATGAELLSRVDVAATAIRSRPERSVLTLTLVHGISYNREITAAIKEYVRGNRPWVMAGAVVGLDYLRQIILPLNRLTGRNLRAFDDEASAAGWLVGEWRRSRLE